MISYGWYLWHWPVGEIWRVTQLDPLSTTQKVVTVIAIPFLLAVATYVGVEKPLRTWRHAHGPRRHTALVVWGLTASIALALGGLGLSARARVVARQDAIRPLDDALRPAWRPCRPAPRDADLPACTIGAGPGARVVLWGDSHAASLYTAVERAAAHAGAAASLRWSGGCPGLVAPLVLGGAPWSNCMKDNAMVLAWLRSPQAADVTGVVLASRWHNAHGIYSIGSLPEVQSGNARTLQSAVGDTVGHLTALGLRVLVVGPMPEFQYRAPECLFRVWKYSLDASRCLVSRANVTWQQQGILPELVAATAAYENARLITPVQLFCDDAVCRAERQGEVLFADGHHLSNAGGRLLYDFFRNAFDWAFQ